MRALFLTALLSLGILSEAAATDYYVSSGANSLVTGVDALGGGRGLSPGLPFATIQFAHDQTAPGDVVYVRQGTYRPPYSSGPGVKIIRSGTPTQWIVYRNYPADAQRPLMQFMSFQGFYVTQGASYIEINGFRVQGNNRNITLADALNQPGSCANTTGSASGVYAGNGISCDATGATGGALPHHLRFINNEVFECGGAGIATNVADYVTIDNNLVYNNCWYSKYGNSGISMNSSRNFDTAPGYHMVITRNRSFGNRLYVPWRNGTVCQGITDGNGIILDLNTTTNPATNYISAFLVANNVIANNGGGAIQIFKTANVDVINNTCYQNSRSPELYATRGEIFTNQANTVLVQNNIMVADYITKANSNYATPNLTYSNNLTFGGIGTDVLGTNAIVADPQFINASVDPFTADFRVFATSPVVNAGLNNLLSATDVTGNPRVVGAAVDLGAYEYDAALAPTFTTWLGGGTTDWNTAANWSAGVPSATLDGYIPANVTPYPVIAANTTIGNLAIAGGASLTLSGGVLDVKGSLNNGGTLTTAPAASFALTGTGPQGLGGYGTLDLWDLTLNNAAGAGLSGRVRVHGVLTLTNGTLTANDRLTLVSDATGTALVNNAGSGTVSGYSTVQRYIDGSVNPSLGYRHYSSPVAGTTVGDLTATGFVPQISQAAVYNASATPGTTTPFPNVFTYDQSRVSLTNSYAPFDRGFVAPTALTTGLTVGRGYVVNINAPAVVDYVGVLNNGDKPVALTRNAAGSANDTDAGWQLLGNPYPAPLDFSLVAPADRANLDAAIYVFSSASQYGGTYRSYANGIGNPVLPLGQAFFARVSTGQTAGTLTFHNSQRLTAPNSTTFQRGTADVRPQVQLELRGTTGPADAFYAYAETGTTPAFDAQFDALKLPNTTGLNLASVAGSGESLSIDGRPVFTANTVLPLAVGVPAAGAYTLTAAALNKLPANLDAVLTDALTGQTVNLRQQPAYSFRVSPAAASALVTGRFSLHFAARVATATAPALTAAEVSLYPTPAHSAFTVLVPAVAGATQVHVDLLNGLGQVVRHQEAALPSVGARLAVDTDGLATGIYTLRLQVGAATLAKRVVLY
ncbi:choice-of-anchor Q domain-containing protein [Hymenobacter terricola]|uniref:choice-of-anchor Q domain-containing protein n=1 Tax=Hymenobacter terricola TaxID=2819236 RepID=UPI001B3041B3|nr:choice-of-anchor Q domain-containing protein [Hymenobacter terricola]